MNRVDIVPVEGVHPEIGLLLAMLDDVTKKWTNELGRVSKETIVWQPRPEAHSIGALILHISDVEAFWLHEVGAGQPLTEAHNLLFLSEATQQYAGRWPTPPKRPLSWYMPQHQSIRERTREFVRNLNDPEHVGRYGKREFTLRWLLHHIISHEAYHDGQAVLLASLRKPLSGQE
jgi:uncharacterized damage-inducible protein DinB